MELEDKVLYYFVKYSDDASEINRRLYNRAWKQLAEYCQENGLPIPIHHLDEEKDLVVRKKDYKILDIDSDIDVPYRIDEIFEGGTLD